MIAYEADKIFCIWINTFNILQQFGRHSGFSLLLNINLTVQFLLTTGNLIDVDFVCMYVILISV